MRLFHAARTRLGLLFARRAAESRMNEEFGFHLEMEAERLVREQGLDPGEARRRASAAFGGLENHKEALRGDRGLAWLGSLSLDLKLGFRMMLKSPALTVISVLGLAVAVAIGAVSFGVIYNVVGDGLPLDEGDRIVSITNLNAGSDNEGRRTHLHDLIAWRSELTALEAIGATRTIDRNLITPGARAEAVRIAEMTASGFRIARVPPLFGRYFNDEDERASAPPVVIIGYTVWQNRFGGERNVVGRTLRLGATEHTIIGVMPRGFAFPINNRVWTPLRLDPLAYERGKAPALDVFGRLAPKASIDDVRTQLETVGRRLTAAYPASHEHVRPRVMPYALRFMESPELTWALYVVQFLVSMLLVVIGTNVAILVYARTASRAGEIAVRTALGASRRRVVAQLFAEALALTSSAAAVGLVGGWFALREVKRFAADMGGEQVPFWMDFSVSTSLVVYVVGLAVLGAVVVGVLPALKATRRRVHVNLQQLGPGGSEMRLGKGWTAMVILQVAVAVALLPAVLYALVIQGRVDGIVGKEIPTHEWVTAALKLDREGIGSEEAIGALEGSVAARYVRLRDELVRRVESDPAVADVVLATAAPNGEPTMRVELENTRAGTSADTVVAPPAGRAVGNSRVAIDYFDSFGVPVLVGRGFQTSDATDDAIAVIVNRSFVQSVLGGGEALGRRIRSAASGREGSPEYVKAGPWLEIVGVVADFPAPESATDVRPKVYRSLTVADGGPVTLGVRIRNAAPATFAPRLRELAVAVDPMLRLDAVRPLDQALSVDRMANRFITAAVSLVTGSVLLLSAAGIYALMSFTIARRRREIGIRAALGAGPRRVLAAVLRRAATQIATGIALGTAFAGALIQTFEGGRADVRGYFLLAGVAGFMAVVGLLATLGPARRALNIQPKEALTSQ